MVDVCLVNVPHSFMSTHKSEVTTTDLKTGEVFFYPPLGLLYLASSLREAGFSVTVLDAPTLKVTLQKLTTQILACDPKIVALSATTPQARSAVQLAKSIKQQSATTKVDIGGPHATLDSEFIQKFPYFDLQFQGEGEISFPEVVKHQLRGNYSRRTISGVNSQNLDDLSFPARDLIDLAQYFIPTVGTRFTSLISSRGCPYACSFCSRPCMPKGIRFRSPSNIYDEITEVIGTFGIEHFQFVDDLFGVNKKLTLKLLEMICHLGITFGFQSRVALLQDDDYVRAFAEAGCRTLSLGVESGDENVRKLNGKPFTEEQLRRAISLCHKHGIKVNSFYVAPLIGDTTETLKTTAIHAISTGTDYVEWHLLIPFPKTEIFDLAVEHGVLEPDVWDNYVSGELENQPTYVPSTLTREFIVSLQREAYKRFFFRPSYIVKRFIQDFTSLTKLRRDANVAFVLAKNFW